MILSQFFFGKEIESVFKNNRLRISSACEGLLELGGELGRTTSAGFCWLSSAAGGSII